MRTIEHLIWAVVVVICVTVFIFHPRPAPAPDPTAVAAEKDVQSLAKTVQGTVQVVRDLEAVKAGSTGISGGIPAAAWAGLAALGRMPTKTVYSGEYRPPTPGPVPTLAPVKNPVLPANFEAWHHADTVAANEEALKHTPVVLHIDQVPAQTNRMAAVYLSDGAAGAVYAVARRKQLDLDLGAASGGSGIEALAGYGYNIKNTDAGLFLGVTLGKSPGAARGVNIGIRAGFLVHP